MSWILTLIFIILGIAFIVIGYKHKIVAITFFGYLFFFIAGLFILGFGIELPVGYVLGGVL